MSISVCLGASTIPLVQAGGHVWFYLNWALALRALGCRIQWLEQAGPEQSADDICDSLRKLRQSLEPFGLAESLAVCTRDSGVVPETMGAGFQGIDAVVEADLLLNLGGKIDARHVQRFRRSALIDIDPGLTQIWASESQHPLTPHDVYFTIGETVGTPAATFPDCGVQWHYAPPCVYLPEWPLTAAERSAPYTTVSSWWGWWEIIQGETFNNEKRTAFLEYLDLPSRTPVALELALALWDLRDHEDVRLLRDHRWSVRHAFDIGGTPGDYRNYLGCSRGEFSCAKPSCMRLNHAWVSDRSLCYMAMGKPAIVQYTGPSRSLPDADGLFRFRNPDEAVKALAVAEADYEYHGRQARALVEEHFNAETCLQHVLERALP
ncbi:MAG: glycosyltransferase [Planctomycetaceae bacterium]